MRVILPAVKEDGTRNIWKPLKSSDSITEKYKANDSELIHLINKSPVWNEGKI